jgi:magnesium transporter
MPDNSNHDEHKPRLFPTWPSVLSGPVRGIGRVLSRSPHDEPAPVTGSSVVNCAIYRNGKRENRVVTPQQACEAARTLDDGFVWLGLHEPSFEELESIASQFGLHPLAVEDAVHAHQRPKLDSYGESLFVVLNTARYVDPTEVISIGEIMLFIGANFVISVRHGEGAALSDVRADLESHPEILTAGPGAVLWAVADRVVDGYLDALNGLAEDIEEIETAVFDPRLSSPTERIYKLKREVLGFRRAVDPLADALHTLARGTHPLVDERVAAYIRDVEDHALRDGARLAGFDQLLSDILQANVAQASLRQNEDMRKITAWAAILTVTTAIAGIYGMNFDHMPELHWRYGYYGCLALIFGISATLYLRFKRRDWL